MTYRDADADLVIEALYQVAANPAAWEQLSAALDPEGADEPPAALGPELRRTAEIARLQSTPGEGAGMGHGPPASVGWVVLGAQGRVLACDPCGREALREVGAGAQTGTAITFDDPSNREAVEAALSAARACGHPVILRLDRPGLESPAFAYAATAGALPGFAAAGAPEALDRPGAAALIFPPADTTERLWSRVRQSFGLTSAEVRLARRLRDGRSVSEAARDLGLSVNTVRNQVRGIFDKMGLQRQSELVAALAGLSALSGAVETQAGRPAPIALAEAPPVRWVALPDGRRLAYRDYGDPNGRPMLSFHEGMGSSLLPAGTDARAAALGLRIVSVDRPGFGRSDPRPDYRFSTVAEDMVVLCDRLGLERVQLGGVLSGGAWALQTAARLGPRATWVFLCSARAPRPVGRAGRSLFTETRARLEANPWVLEALYAILRVRLSHRLTRALMKRSAAPSSGDRAWLAEHPELIDLVWASTAEALGRDGRGPIDDLKAFRAGPPPDLSGLTAPITVWHGDQDEMAPMADLLAYLGARASEVRVLEGIGHLMVSRHWPEVLERMAKGPP